MKLADAPHAPTAPVIPTPAAKKTLRIARDLLADAAGLFRLPDLSGRMADAEQDAELLSELGCGRRR